MGIGKRMIHKEKRNELLTCFFQKNEEVLINARDLVEELQTKDSLERSLKVATQRIFDLQESLERARGELMYPSYRRFDIKG